MKALAFEDPQHPPLYYVLDRWWIRVAGDTVADRRALSAIVGTLAIGIAYLLGAEVGGTVLAGLVFAALFALSPFQIIYSQEAREYSLWGFAVLTSTWLLLRALRLGNAAIWGWYALSLVIGLYTDLLFANVLLGHAAIVLKFARHQWRPMAVFGVATLAALAAFAPWLVAVVRGAGLLTNNPFLGASLPVSVYAAKWAFNASTVFIDLEYRYPIATVLLLIVGGIWVYSTIILIRSAHMREAIVVAALIVPSSAVMLALDLLHHESRATAGRYLVPTWIGLELLVALGVAASIGSSMRVSRIGTLIFVFLASVGALSAIADSPADWSWSDTSVAPIRPVARIINDTPRSVVVFRTDPSRWDFTVAQLVNVLRPDVRIRLLAASSPLNLAATKDALFLLDPSAATRNAVLHAGYSLEARYVEAESVSGLAGIFRKRARAARDNAGVFADQTSLWRVSAKRVAPSQRV